MAAIDLSSISAPLNDGILQLQNGVAMSSTLTSVTDQSNTASTLKLSTTSAQFTSPLRITTDDPSDMYLDCEDGATNNRFNITRNTASQQVNLNFASNPGGSTTVVGGIRTYVDGVNLTEVMKFREDGQLQIGSTAASAMYWDNTNNRLGVGTNAPTEIGHFYNTALSDIYLKIQTTQSRTAGVVSQNSTANWFAGTQYSATNAYQVFDQTNNRLQLTMFNTGNSQFSFSNIAMGAKLGIQGSGSTSATTSLLVQDSAGTNLMTLRDDGIISLFSASKTGQLDIQGGVNSGVYAKAYNSQSDNIIRYKDYNGNQCMTLTMTGSGAGALVVNSNTNNASAVLQADSTTKGFLPPRMTDAQRAAISSPAEGLLVYNTDNHAVAYRDGTNWGYLCGALQNVTGAGGTQNILFASGNIVNLTLNASTTLTFSGHVVGTYIIQVTQGGAGSNTLTYPASVKWSGGTAPTLTTTVGKTDILTFYHDGTSFFGTYSLNY